ncbi:MAG: N-acetylmuramoyl-L-alanine amidase [Bryobacteraceae bacterium]|nr:N-acetylmuramoyl-L-alanine amidase [Bryobacteraceae bacterium]
MWIRGGFVCLLLALSLPAETRRLTATGVARAVGIAAGGEAREVQVRFSDGRTWSAWRTYGTDPEEGTLIWLDEPARVVEVEGAGDARLLLIDPGITPTRDAKRAADPAIQGRADWCPAPFVCPKNSDPSFTRPTHLIVHHTAGNNAAADWAAVMRAIWELHVRGNGWADIGYNFLVDPNGVAYEGRGDGILGAHFSAVNTGTAGISMIGTYTDRPPSDAALATLLDLLTWQAQRYQLDPYAETLHAASALELNVISGHRDAGLSPRASGRTECPGLALYPVLPALREEVCRRVPGCVAARQRENTCAAATTPCVSRYGVVNSANYDARPVAAGSIAAAFGANLNGLRATVNGRAATVIGGDASQLNFLVPLNTEPGTSRLQLFSGNDLRVDRLIWVTEAAPAIYLALNHDEQTLNSPSAPVTAGRPLTLYLAGGRTGLPWSVTVGGVRAEPLFLGAAPGFLGIWQANLTVPAGLASGDQPLVLSVSGVPSAAFPVRVR